VKFIHCFSEELKNKLLQSGFRLLYQGNSFFIFENNSSLHFDFTGFNKSQFIFSNKLVV
jgi:hypothetical protein